MIPLRATIRSRADVRVRPLLFARLQAHRNIRIDADSFLALIPGAGSVIVSRGADALNLDAVVERRELMPIVIAALEAETRRDGIGERVSVEWTTPDRVPVALR
ncbi:hypothetical protein HQQ80_21490 [Microbacteriaceae bacterium VKM Ac-2855]|nr:hypothetical protein [Microbacteriaceae bacterium VKM Ac-2855]